MDFQLKLEMRTAGAYIVRRTAAYDGGTGRHLRLYNSCVALKKDRLKPD